MTTSNINTSSTNDAMHFPIFPVLLIGFFIVVLTVVLGGPVWQKYQEGVLLEGPAKGADQLFEKRKYDVWKVIAIKKDIDNTRSPGSYMRALELWESVMNERPIHDAAPWVLDLQKQEREELLKALSVDNADVADIPGLKEKLKKISPQLNEEETKALNAFMTQITVLAITREKTALDATQKMHEMGSGTATLSSIGLKMPKFKPVQM